MSIAERATRALERGWMLDLTGPIWFAVGVRQGRAEAAREKRNERARQRRAEDLFIKLREHLLKRPKP